MLRFTRNLSVLAKIFGANALVIAVIVGFQVIYFPNAQMEQLERALVQKCLGLILLMRHQVAPAMDFGDARAVTEVFQGVARDPDFRRALFFDEAGEIPVWRGVEDPTKYRPSTWPTTLQTENLNDVVQITAPVVSKSGVKGLMILALSKDTIFAQGRSIQWTALGIGGLLLVFGFIVAFVLAGLMGRRLEAVAAVAADVADGNLGQELLDSSSTDAIGRTADAFNRMLASQRKLVEQIVATAVELNLSAEEFFASAQQQEQGVTEQSSSIEEITRAFDGLSGSAGAISKHADELAKLGQDTSVHVEAAQGSLDTTRNAIDEIVLRNEIVTDRINKLYKGSEAIISVVDIIEDISDRLDLLALNAALEGSRAGDTGKGFALVAQEMRRLADNVTGSTKEIKSTVQEIHGYIKAALEASQQGSSATKQGAQQMDDMSASMAQVFSLIALSTESAQNIMSSTKQQLSSTEQVVMSMREVSNVSSEGTILAQHVTKAANSIADLASRLRSQVNAFRLNGSNDDLADPADVEPADGARPHRAR